MYSWGNFGSLLVILLIFGEFSPKTNASWFNYLFQRLPGSYVNPDTNRNIYQLIQSRGFDYESHYVQTQDGYILQMVRIVNPFLTKNKRKRLKPVLLHHGFQCSGSLWLVTSNGTLDSYGNYLEFGEAGDVQTNRLEMINGTKNVANTLSFVLATRGYDVWLANYRGSIYSRNHTKLNVNSNEFWQFSMDEMIHYDLPAQIDYILKKTNRCTLSYIGHSQGNLMMFALMSINDHYANLIEPFIALSPVFYNVEIPSALSYFKYIRTILRSFSTFVPFSESTRLTIANICQNHYIRSICFAFSYPFLGSQTQNLIQERIPVYLSAVPMGSSSWNAAHLFQMYSAKNGQPEYFDLGKWKNFELYGRIKPPIYDASKINSTNIALIYSGQDWLNHIKSVRLLKSKLKVQLFDDYQIPDKTYNHMDMIWAKNVGTLVNTRILNLLSEF